VNDGSLLQESPISTTLAVLDRLPILVAEKRVRDGLSRREVGLVTGLSAAVVKKIECGGTVNSDTAKKILRWLVIKTCQVRIEKPNTPYVVECAVCGPLDFGGTDSYQEAQRIANLHRDKHLAEQSIWTHGRTAADLAARVEGLDDTGRGEHR
jgi:transcriptional regulator with XRE-family HTH domain